LNLSVLRTLRDYETVSPESSIEAVFVLVAPCSLPSVVALELSAPTELRRACDPVCVSPYGSPSPMASTRKKSRRSDILARRSALESGKDGFHPFQESRKHVGTRNAFLCFYQVGDGVAKAVYREQVGVEQESLIGRSVTSGFYVIGKVEG
jgi:hypothetical protein